MEKDSFFPADLLLLSSTNDDGIAYVETVNLDGESNLKIKKALDQTKGLTHHNIATFKVHPLLLQSPREGCSCNPRSPHFEIFHCNIFREPWPLVLYSQSAFTDSSGLHFSPLLYPWRSEDDVCSPVEIRSPSEFLMCCRERFIASSQMPHCTPSQATWSCTGTASQSLVLWRCRLPPFCCAAPVCATPRASSASSSLQAMKPRCTTLPRCFCRVLKTFSSTLVFHGAIPALESSCWKCLHWWRVLHGSSAAPFWHEAHSRARLC